MWKKLSNKCLFISLVLMLVSAFGAYWIQTSGTTVTVKDMRWETPSGHQMSALLFVPSTATSKTPAPAIVTSHGWYNTREMQDLNFIEYSRRGYVVVAIDMYGHGNSDPVSPSEWKNRGTGMYDAVELVSRLPYVDASSIGITGHSNGARASNWSVLEDNKKPEDERLIASVLLIANDAMYTDHPEEPLYWKFRTEDQPFVNRYGTRDVGLIAAQYDEFFFRRLKEDGTSMPPREFAQTDYAQSFLNFGEKPTQARQINTFYTQTMGDKEVLRILHTPNQIHPWNHFSKEVVADSLAFFERSLGAPSPLAQTDQVWIYKAFFNALGLIGFFLFVIGITKALLATAFFNPLLASSQRVITSLPSKTSKLWFWGGAIVTVLISAFSYIGVYHWTIANRPDFLLQPQVYYIGVWSLVMAVVGLLIMAISYWGYNKKQGMNLRETGVVISWCLLWKTLVLSLSVVALSFLCVFVVDYFFKVDFRLWVLTVKTFSSDKLWMTLAYWPFFLAFYVVNSLAINAFNYFKLADRIWTNTALMMLLNGLSAALLIIIQYGHFYSTGEIYFTSVSHIVGIWLFPMVVMIPLGALIMRAIYKDTNNPYLGGLIYSLIISILMTTNTLTQLS